MPWQVQKYMDQQPAGVGAHLAAAMSSSSSSLAAPLGFFRGFALPVLAMPGLDRNIVARLHKLITELQHGD
jgi:hypothetical protein